MKLSKFGDNDRCRQYSPDQFRPWGSFQNWTSRHKVRLPLGLTNQRKLHYYGWENPSKFWGLLGRLNNAFYALNLLSTCWLYYRYERGWIYFCLYYHPANWELHSWFTHSARGWMGKGRPFTQPYSALNKINKTYVPTFSARHNFSFYERKTISLKKKKPSVQHYGHFKEFITSIWDPGGTTKFILLWEWLGEITLPRIHLRTWCFFAIV